MDFIGYIEIKSRVKEVGRNDQSPSFLSVSTYSGHTWLLYPERIQHSQHFKKGV